MANNNEEIALIAQGYNLICGVDESGVGCYAGDVYVGAVIFPTNIDYKNLLPGLNDSKQKTPKERNVLYNLIHKYALVYSTASASVEEIDRLNIYWAKFLAARRALEKLSIRPDYVIIDGNKTIPEITTPQHAIVKGDAKSISIAAASILAKVERDMHIDELARLVHPDFDWINNKSYHCRAQIEAVKKHGKTIYHRQKYYETLITKYVEEKDDGKV